MTMATRGGTRTPASPETRAAINIGKTQADEAMKRLARSERERATALESMTVTEATTTAGVLVAEGDSWFDYPMADVLRLLEDAYAYDVESVAHKGDRVEDMAYTGGQLDDFTRRIQKLLRRGIVPKAILLSGGGNDVAGDEFAILLNHSSSATRGLSPEVLNGVIERIRLAYVTILTAVTRVCQQQVQKKLPIILHGYDYPVPDGRGFMGGFWLLPGPWLEPGFRLKGYSDKAERLKICVELIDRFNAMLKEVVALPGFAHVQHLDLRGSLSNAGDYKKDWANELHPTERGWRQVTGKFAKALGALP